MTPLRIDTLQGVWGSVLLPIGSDDAIDWDRLGAELDILASSELDGVYAHGTAGEFHALSDEEYERVSAMLAESCARKAMAFQIGASHPVALTTLARIRRTRELEPGAYQVVLPDWLALTEDECVAFVRGVAEAAAPTPLVLYNPPHAKTQATPALLARLLDDVPSLIGIKVAGGDDAWYESMRAPLERCAVFVPGHHLANGLARGAAGSYSNVAALSPDGAVRWYETMRSDPAAAADVERRIAEFFARHIAPLQAAGLSNPALDKFLAAVGDWADIGLRIRWPYDSAPGEAVAPARRDAHALLPELFGV
ncbi:dihydrodipicolinate synthase family protein [Solicola gregarius]|uniref:Dihydrodipicolinate synthase family protein n=1 Tax=Solicola gregarius TaxID=2908642 RepID=A0AA46THX3_9ACTN|nr:dihydrodipicolinate synthase family protein [Solicola gregarius]UYM05575.1 dihydrodipicolinate synthase family protein [Solicola gregarius]